MEAGHDKMETRHSRFGSGLVAGLLATLLVLLLTALVVAYTGVYNIAASAGHTAGVRWLMDSTKRSSVRSHAPDDDASAWLPKANVAAGAREYKAMCEHCHGGPGIEPSRWSRGMLPRPPHMTEAATHWQPDEVLWIIRHGIKLTGMPSFAGHDDATLRDIAGFVDRLPDDAGAVPRLRARPRRWLRRRGRAARRRRAPGE